MGDMERWKVDGKHGSENGVKPERKRGSDKNGDVTHMVITSGLRDIDPPTSMAYDDIRNIGHLGYRWIK